MKKLLKSSLVIATAAFLATAMGCSTDLEGQPDTPRQENTETPDVELSDTLVPTPADDCAAIVDQANATQDASLENELEDCLAEGITRSLSDDSDDEDAPDDVLCEGESAQEIADCFLGAIEEAGVELPNLDECQPLLDGDDLEGFAECVSEAIWEDADLPELEDECLDLLDDSEGSEEEFADCVADQLGDPDVPLPDGVPCLELLESDEDAFAECVADEIEDRIEELAGPCGDVLSEQGSFEEFLACIGEEIDAEEPSDSPGGDDDDDDPDGLPADLPCADAVEAAIDNDESPLGALFECLGDLAGVEGDLDAPCLGFLDDGDLEGFGACLEGELPEPGQDEPDDDEPSDEPDDEPDFDDIADPCQDELDAAFDADSDEAWDAFDQCLEDTEAGVDLCFDILDDPDLSDEDAFTGFRECMEGL